MKTTPQASDDEAATRMSMDVLLHELRTPLASIRGYTQLIRKRRATCEIDSGRLSGALDGIEAATVRIMRILDDYHSLQRTFATSAAAPQVQPLDLVALVRQVVAEAALEHGAGARLAFLAATSDLRGRWDPSLLERVLTNLIA